MDPMTISLLASGVLGMLKGNQEQGAYKDQQKIEALKERWSPFTHQAGQNLKRPNSMDPMMQSLMAGAMIGQSMKGAGADAAAAPAAGSPALGGANPGPQMASQGFSGYGPYAGGYGQGPTAGYNVNPYGNMVAGN